MAKQKTRTRIPTRDEIFASGFARIEAKKAVQDSTSFRWLPCEWAVSRKIELWSKQKQLLNAIVHHKRVAVHSAHAQGKTWTAALCVCWWISTRTPGEARAFTCYTDDTSVLTKDGWKLLQEVKVGPDGDLFATRNPVTKAFEWQNATKFYDAEYDGEVVDLKGRLIHLRVTPNHRVLKHWSDKGKSGEVFRPAGTLTGRYTQIPIHTTWNGVSPETVTFGRYTWPTTIFARFLGAWLADGSLGPNRYPERGEGCEAGAINLTRPPGTKGYDEFKQMLLDLVGRVPTYSGNKTWSIWCPELWRYLRALGTAATKRVPDEVKDWSSEDLQELLSYYLLGDGAVRERSDGSGAWSVQTVSRQLALDFQEIGVKLGTPASIVEREPRDAMIEGRVIRKEDCNPVYSMHFRRSMYGVKPSRSHYKGRVYCVSVPNETILVRRGDDSPVWCGNTAPSAHQVQTLLWGELGKLWPKTGTPGRCLTTELKLPMPNGQSDFAAAWGRKPSDHDVAAFQGVHATEGVLIIFDEAAGIASNLIEDADKNMTGDDDRLLLIGNPDDASSYFARICSGAIPGWHVIHFDGFDSPNFTGEEVSPKIAKSLMSKAWAKGQLEKYGENSAIYQARVRGKFLAGSSETVLTMALIGKVCGPPEEDAALTPHVLGIDVGGGGDLTVVQERRGMVAGRTAQFRSSDPEATAQWLVDTIVAWGVTEVRIDEIGIGWGIMGALKGAATRGEHHAKIVGVNVANTANDPTRFANRRSELWWLARERCENGDWNIDALSEDAKVQLTWPKWSLDPKGRIRVEKKEDTIERHGHSPDDADAVNLAWADPAGPGLAGVVSAADIRGDKPKTPREAGGWFGQRGRPAAGGWFGQRRR